MELRRISVSAAILGLALLVTACGDTAADDRSVSPEATEEVRAASASVTIERSRFEPDVLRVAPGTTVTFENLDPYAHTVTSSADARAVLDSGDLPEARTYTHEFEEPGEYTYFCEIHPTMRASVIVE